MDRLTRKELKTDHFVEGFGDTVGFLQEHRTEVIRYGGIAIVVLAVAIGFYFYQKKAKSERQQALYEIQVAQGYAVSPTGTGTEGTRVFRSEEEKSAYLTKAYTDLANRYSGSDEACIAEFSLGARNAATQKFVEAQSHLEKAASCKNSDLASLAKFSLGQVMFAQGKRDQGEKILRDLIANPSPLVSSGQATLTLARMMMPYNPAEVKKLLEPLRGTPDSVGREALVMLSELQQK